ncbi:MAG: hypothetical protein DSY57_06430 [Desulfobulbus sp.]|nr:MAG: hypothetical protein DSY57_06430 [Desulfobulbus sp.]
MSVQQDQWTVETAMEIMQHPTVDSKIWAEAVEWLMLYGPPEIQELLRQASGHATKESFPELAPTAFTADGEPCYNVADLAQALHISEEEAAEMIAEKERQHGIRQLFDEQETTRLQ